MVSINETLRASEFVGTLNGGDHQAILTVLKQFCRTVRKERQISLSLVDEDDSCSDYEGDASSNNDIDTVDMTSDAYANAPPAKKYKKSEDWKADTGSYHVPFVGTAIARGEQAELIKGEWPTGLVAAYLESSPLALELLSDDFAPDGQIHKTLLKKKKAKLSLAISKAHQLAVAELLTVAIPKDKLQNNCSAGNKIHIARADIRVRFLKNFKDSHLPRLFDVLNDETEKGRRRSSQVGRCSTLIAPALKVLKYFAMISTSNARLVARNLDESLLDGVLHVCLRPLHINQDSSSSSLDGRITNSDESRIEAIRLATCLLDANDGAVDAYICTGGSKERKMKPGILFIALREGLATLDSKIKHRDHAIYNVAVAKMLGKLRVSMLTGSNLTNPRLHFNLVARDPLQHLCRLASHAPALLNKHNYIRVLEGDEKQNFESALMKLGVEARRLLFLLLSDREASPFLPNFGIEHVARSMIRLLDSQHADIGMRNFLLYCTKENPALMQGLFKLLTTPDSKNRFSLVSRVSFITLLLSKGPSPRACVSAIGERNICIRDILPLILPLRLRGHVLTKALQNGNNLVRLEIFKMIILILERFRSLREDGRKRYNWEIGFTDILTLATFQWLPDLQILLSLRSRFHTTSGGRGCAILSNYLFRVIESYIIILPSQVETLNFDWMKLLPYNALEFNQAPLFLQVRILQCLQIIMKFCRQNLEYLLLSSTIVFEIMISTKSTQINDTCRKIIMRLMSAVLLPKFTDRTTSECIREEMSLWIDGILDSNISTVFKLFREVLSKSSRQLAFLCKSWKISKVPKHANFSNLLAAAFSTDDDSSRSFALLVGQVTARRLVTLNDPSPLAAAIVYADKEESCVSRSEFLSPLVAYARVIFEFNDDNPRKMSCVEILLSSYFDNDSPITGILSFFTKTNDHDTSKTLDWKSLMTLSPTRLLLFTKILNHTFKIFLGNNIESTERYWRIIRRIIPCILLHYLEFKSIKRKFSFLLHDIYALAKMQLYPGFHDVCMLIFSCPFSASNDFIKMKKSVLIDAIYESRNALFLNTNNRSTLLCIGLLKNNWSDETTEKIRLSLISDNRNTFSNLCLQFLSCCFWIKSEARQFRKSFSLDKKLLQTSVNALVWIGKVLHPNGKLIHRQIKARICLMLACTLKKETVDAACLLSLIGKIPETSILDLCFDFSIEEKALVLAEVNFLITLIRTDLYRILGPMLSYFQNMRPRMLTAWEAGYLDNFIISLLVQVKYLPEVSNSLFEAIASKVLKRFIASQNVPILDDTIPLLKLMCALFDKGNGVVIKTTLIVEKVINTLSHFLTRENILYHGDLAKSLCTMSISILEHLDDNDERSKNLKRQLSSELFYVLFTGLPIILKKHTAHQSERLPSELVFTWLIRLLQENSKYVLKKIESALSQKVFRACLKHGVAVGSHIDKTPTISLHFLGFLMTKLFHEDYFVSLDKISAQDVFLMVVSHSRFEQIFTGENDEDMIPLKEAKTCILRLMNICVMISPNEILIKPMVWKVIFASFNAGVSDLDILIRNLIKISSKDSLPFIDEIYWKGCERDDQILNPELDWLVNALDKRRIRASISKFPSFDKVDPEISLDNIWAKDFLSKRFHLTEQPVETCRSPSDIVNHELQTYSFVGSKTDGELDDTEQYSPAFLLPMLLKTIKIVISQKDSVGSQQYNSGISGPGEDKQEQMLFWGFTKSSIASIQRLCEKDIVSLCLVSLSSMCEKVRCYAVSILGIILQACHTEYALGSSSWRDRPQLVMILNSVQRSLVLHKALEEVDFVVPRVTPVIAMFWARAAIVLPKPDDALYVPINRYFLKHDNDHGAFQDMKRLPAFMSLFCSSSDGSNQSRAERMWGLQMLCDGLVDATCYKLVTSCHAPELIFSSFEHIRLSKASDEAKGAEICLLFGSLKSMIDHGGHGAHVHLIWRCGLVSWMSSICTSRSQAVALPTERSRIAFCQLSNAVMESLLSTHRIRISELFDEICSMIQPLLTMCLMACHRGQSSRAIYQASFKALRILSIGLQYARDGADEEFKSPDIHPLGVSFESSLLFLRIADDSMKSLAMHTLCQLPVSINKGQREKIQDLIISILDVFRNTSSNDDDKMIMKRILLLVEQFDVLFPSNIAMSKSIVAKTFAIRCHSRFPDKDFRELWSRCLKCLTKQLFIRNTDKELFELTICMEVLRNI